MNRTKYWMVLGAIAALVSMATVAFATEQQGGSSPPAAPFSSPPALTEPAQAEQAKTDPFQVPDGTPEQLLEYIQSLRTVRPEALDPDSLDRFRKKLLGAVLEAAEKILAQQAPEKIALEAVQLKIAALAGLAATGDQKAAAALKTFPADLEKAGKPKLATRATTLLLLRQLEEAMAAPAEKLPALVDQVAKHLGKGTIGRAEVQLAMLTSRLCEATGQQQLALRAYTEFGKLFSANSDEQIARIGNLMSGTARRLGLPGKTIELEGTTTAGDPFDWSKYKGKVVLVMFWATWCGPCRQELPVVLENYQTYHDRGFDVVGISVDEDREALDNFLAEQKLPWTVVFDNAAGQDSMANRYGVFAIPQSILVGRDGKVISVEVRGAELRKQLEELIGPAEPNASKPASDQEG